MPTAPCVEILLETVFLLKEVKNMFTAMSIFS